MVCGVDFCALCYWLVDFVVCLGCVGWCCSLVLIGLGWFWDIVVALVRAGCCAFDLCLWGSFGVGV